jgi:hypothetical protein
VIPQSYILPAAVFLVIGGVIAWAAGLRLFRLVLTLFGFILGALIGSSSTGTSDTTLLIFAALGGGAVGAIIMFLGYFVGVALVGAGVGALVAHLIWRWIGTDPHVFVVVLASVAGAAGAMTLERYVIVTVTAFGGAWSALTGVLLFMNRPAAPVQPTLVLYPFELLRRPWWVQLTWVGLGLVGMFVQMKVTGGRKSKI